MALSQLQIRQNPFVLLRSLSKQNLVRAVRLSGLEEPAVRELNASLGALDLAPRSLDQLLAERLRDWIQSQLKNSPQQQLLDALLVVARERQQMLSSPAEKRVAGQLSVWLRLSEFTEQQQATKVLGSTPAEVFVQPRLF